MSRDSRGGGLFFLKSGARQTPTFLVLPEAEQLATTWRRRFGV